MHREDAPDYDNARSSNAEEVILRHSACEYIRTLSKSIQTGLYGVVADVTDFPYFRSK